MSNSGTKISDLTAATSVNDTDVIPFNNAGITKKLSWTLVKSSLKTYFDTVYTKTLLGLGNVDNTSDLNKPISTATQTALDLKAAKGANSDITSMTALASINGGQLAGFRNRFRNGSMVVSSRATASTVTAGTAVPTASAGYPCVDGWFVYCTGANVTAEQTTTATLVKRLLITGAASVTAVGVGQRIRSENIYDLAGSTVTLGVDLANSLLTSVTWTAYYANAANTFGTIGTPTKTQIATGTFTVTSTVSRYSAQIALPANAINGVEIVFTVGAQTSGTFTIGDVQLEKGSVATPFERRPLSVESMLCLPYYENSYGLGGTPGTATVNGSHGSIISTIYLVTSPSVSFLVSKAYAPIIVLRATDGTTTGVVSEYNTASVFVANRTASTSGISTGGFSVIGLAGDFTVGSQAKWHWEAHAEVA